MVVSASEASWRCVQAGDKEGWLALMTDDVLVEDPIGPSVTNPEGTGVRGKGQWPPSSTRTSDPTS